MKKDARPEQPLRLIVAHKFKRESHEHYVDESWCSERLFEEEAFPWPIWDPACGWGRIGQAAPRPCRSTDLVNRGYGIGGVDFLKTTKMRAGSRSIICNPPFNLMEEFALHSLKIGAKKVAMIALVRRLPAARWLQETPLSRVWLMTPRPSMPTGRHIREGGKVGGGTQDFCWLVWEREHRGPPTIRWLHRDDRVKPRHCEFYP
jgi:hypothetical protein